MTKDDNILWRVEQLEKGSCGLEEKVDKILTNHLPHIQSELMEMRGNINSLSTRITLGIGVNIVLLIAGVLGVVLLLKK
jgi:hypothetical protein